MNVYSKLRTLFRASARESVERVTDANAVRIYKQEILEAEELLSRRREALAATIACRSAIEQDIASLERRIGKREQQVNGLAEAERTEEMLTLAATEIAEIERELEALKDSHVERCRDIHREELALRKLLGEIREHRRELGLLDSRSRRPGAGAGGGQTIAGRLASLRETRSAISDNLSHGDQLEAGMAEAIERVDESPFDRALSRSGRDDAALRVASVLNRLRGTPGNA